MDTVKNDFSEIWTFSLSRVQNRTCADYAEVGKGRKNFNLFVKPSGEQNLFGLCRGRKRKKEFLEIKSTDSVGLFGK